MSKILIIDNIDSFVYNIYQYVGEIGAKYDIVPIVLQNNCKIEEVEALMDEISGIVISPGPKTPKEAGISNTIIKKYFKEKPILGVCLGHQCIGYVFNAKIIRADILKHGKTSLIRYNEKSGQIFKGIKNPFVATRYHSLVIDEKTIREPLQVTAHSVDGNEVMAIKHKDYDLYGIQFHPESILTTDGKKIVKNFIKICV